MPNEYYLIDACSAYIEGKDAHYLAKEGYAVHYASSTGRKSDYTWHRLTTPEMLRMIKALKLSMDKAKFLKEHHIVAAFQELGRVYEYAVRSRWNVGEGIFNYNEHCETSLGSDIMSALAVELVQRGYRGLLLMEVMEVYMELQSKLDSQVNFPDARELLCKHFEELGFEIKSGAYRPLYKGRKTPAIMMGGALPRDIIQITEGSSEVIINKIFGELK